MSTVWGRTETVADRRSRTERMTVLATAPTVAVSDTEPGSCAETVPSSTDATAGSLVDHTTSLASGVGKLPSRDSTWRSKRSPGSTTSGRPTIAIVTRSVEPGTGLNGELSSSAVRPLDADSESSMIRSRMGSPGLSGLPFSALTAASTSEKRSAGAFASMRMTAASTSVGQSGRISRMGGGGDETCDIIISYVEPLKGTSPVSISYATIPKAY